MVISFSLQQRFTKRCERYILYHGHVDRSGRIILLVIASILAGAYVWSFEQIHQAKSWNAIAHWPDSWPLLPAGLVVLWMGLIAYLWLLNSEMWSEVLSRLAEFLRGSRSPGTTAHQEAMRFIGLTAAFGGLAYLLEGRLNGFATGFWQVDIGLHAFITILLVFPALAALFVAVTAYKLREFEVKWE